jgi:hypothetical protein
MRISDDLNYCFIIEAKIYKSAHTINISQNVHLHYNNFHWIWGSDLLLKTKVSIAVLFYWIWAPLNIFLLNLIAQD